ncbi:PREDICTED: putative F-box protein At1g12855 [Camelina sativa]|uniref:F-box protein At1g12855 n=1 Tax=Camelina sativa TaxID=90675 RepID=A0ABM0YIM1_CAMSA|nr:PREDICTED: putative F-box protein At1g12855 [Camelina sativa]
MPTPRLAFAKATMCDYKLVWLYNSDAGRLSERFTECEVFDFRTNTWRYLDCTPTYRIFDDQSPVSTNGSVYWLTERYNGETKVIVFDLQTENFRLLPNNPVSRSHPDHIDLCILDNHLCMSKRKRRTMIQEIWSLQISSSKETWIKIYTIDLRSCSSSWSVSGRVYSKWTRKHVIRPCTPVAILKNKEILLTHRYGEGLVKYDPQTNSYSLMYNHLFHRAVPYFKSLISHS